MGEILGVEPDLAVLESRCAVLKVSGYDTVSTSPQMAQDVLSRQKFGLIVLSGLNDADLHRIIDLSNGANILVLDGLTTPSELLSSVAERLSVAGNA